MRNTTVLVLSVFFISISYFYLIKLENACQVAGNLSRRRDLIKNVSSILSITLCTSENPWPSKQNKLQGMAKV